MIAALVAVKTVMIAVMIAAQLVSVNHKKLTL